MKPPDTFRGIWSFRCELSCLSFRHTPRSRSSAHHMTVVSASVRRPARLLRRLSRLPTSSLSNDLHVGEALALLSAPSACGVRKVALSVRASVALPVFVRASVRYFCATSLGSQRPQ